MPQAIVPKKIFEKYSLQRNSTDSGSSESQIALLTHRIKHLTTHLKTAPKDCNCKRSITKMVSKRKRLLNYLLTQKNPKRHEDILKELSLRK